MHPSFIFRRKAETLEKRGRCRRDWEVSDSELPGTAENIRRTVAKAESYVLIVVLQFIVYSADCLGTSLQPMRSSVLAVSISVAIDS